MTDEERGQDAPRAGGAAAPDYFKKYQGQVRKFNQVAAELELVRQQLELAQAQLKDREAKLSEYEQAVQRLTGERDEAAKRFQALDNRVRAIKTASEKYPHLRGAIDQGLLRDPDEFKAPEDYEAYLAKVSESFKVDAAQPKPAEGQDVLPNQQPSTYLPGQVPSVSARVTPTMLPRPPQVIADEMASLAPTDPRWRELEAELQASVNASLPALGRQPLSRPPTQG